ncbi:MAG: sodium-dependent transporter [bacterium]|nr:sodium-dependent transporter [bacterium]
MEKLRETWGSNIGFILAATGSAIGLGNIWKFPYITGDYGGGAFVLVYLACVLMIGLPLMVAELIIGRRAQKNPVKAFEKNHRAKSPWQLTGWLGMASGFIILSFYSVIAGWAMAYIFKSIRGFAGTSEQIQQQFVDLVLSPSGSIMWHTIFMVLVIGIVAGGIKGGIERWSKILMPALFMLLLGLMLHGLFNTTGGIAALNFLFAPDFSRLTAEAVLSALGHAFFTLSLGMGAMITYGSYMKKGSGIVKDAIIISFLDTFIALMAGVAIFSLVFHYGMEPGQSVGLIFKTLPVLFADTGPWVSVPFFILLTFAALTSGISLLEVVVVYFIDEKGWSRVKITLLAGGLVYIFGLLSAIATLTIPFRGSDQTFLDVFDFMTTNYMLPLGGLFTCLFIGWVMKEDDMAEEFGSRGMLLKLLRLALRYLTPIGIAMVLLHGLELLPFMDY